MRILLQLSGVSKNYGERVLFEDVTFNVLEGKKIAFVGPNGSGKTTLLKMIEGIETTEIGEIRFMPWAKMSVLKQNDPFVEHETVADFLARTGAPETWKFGKVLKEFGFEHDDQYRLVESFSGGWQMRLRLVAIVLQEPNLILLDEPTNYLDVNTLIYLEHFIKTFAGTVVMVSHDQIFLEKTCNQVVVFEGKRKSEDGKSVVFGLSEFPGTIQEYLAYRLENEATAAEKNKQIERKQAQLQIFVDKFRAKASKASAAQSKIKIIEKLEDEKLGLGVARKKVRMKLPPAEKIFGNFLTTTHLEVGYDGKKVATVKDVQVVYGDKIAVVGENGQGKSTLFKTLMGQLPPINGQVTWKTSLRLLDYGQNVYKVFHEKETIQMYLNRTVGALPIGQLMRVMGSFLFTRDDLSKPVNILSGGEKSRVYLASMFLLGADVYLLDEPTNHLDFETIDILARALQEFEGTVLVISHNRAFLEIFATKVWRVAEGLIVPYSQGYEYYIQQLELEATKDEVEAFESEDDFIPKSIKKSGRVRYELEKELKKLQKKLENLGLDKIEKDALEARWLEVENELA